MSYFQNVSETDWSGVYVISDRQYSKTYKVNRNKNTSYLMVNWNDEPYNTNTANKFGIKYSINGGAFYNQINVTLTSGAARTANQIVADLNANSTFTGIFTAFVTPSGNRLAIRATNNARESFRAYIPNITDTGSPTASAEIVLGFNKQAPVVELPSFFERYAINATDTTYSTGHLILLSQPNENYVITNYGLSTTPKSDYQFLAGTSGLFNFQKITVDGSNRITQIIEYPAGGTTGDLARKISYSYTGANTNPSQITEVPYTLTSGDLVTPP